MFVRHFKFSDGSSLLKGPHISSFSHLTTHHPVRNCQRSSDPPVRVPMAYAIGRFSDIARPPGGRLKMGHGVAFPPEPRAQSLLSWHYPGTSAHIRPYPAIKKIKNVPGSLSPPPNWRSLAKFADQNPPPSRPDPAFGNWMANMRSKNSLFHPVAWHGQARPGRSGKPPV